MLPVAHLLLQKTGQALVDTYDEYFRTPGLNRVGEVTRNFAVIWKAAESMFKLWQSMTTFKLLPTRVRGALVGRSTFPNSHC